MTKRLIVLIPHPDDGELSMWPYIHYLASGYDVHLVYLTRGEVTAASLHLDGALICNWGDHAYRHNPAVEGYALPTVEQIGLARLAEGRSAAGAMAMIPPTIATEPGFLFTHDENLGTGYGCGGCGSSSTPATEAGIALADEVIRRYAEEYPNSLFWAMSPTDDHPDHAASGIALRRLKGNPVYNATTKTFTFTGGDPVLAPLLVNANFMASKLYWGNGTTPRPADLAAELPAWYPNTYPYNNLILPRVDEYTAWIKTKVVKAYKAWNPAQGSFAIGGGHSTAGQFESCFGQSVTRLAALWHV